MTKTALFAHSLLKDNNRDAAIRERFIKEGRSDQVNLLNMAKAKAYRIEKPGKFTKKQIDSIDNYFLRFDYNVPEPAVVEYYRKIIKGRDNDELHNTLQSTNPNAAEVISIKEKFSENYRLPIDQQKGIFFDTSREMLAEHMQAELIAKREGEEVIMDENKIPVDELIVVKWKSENPDDLDDYRVLPSSYAQGGEDVELIDLEAEDDDVGIWYTSSTPREVKAEPASDEGSEYDEEDSQALMIDEDCSSSAPATELTDSVLEVQFPGTDYEGSVGSDDETGVEEDNSKMQSTVGEVCGSFEPEMQAAGTSDMPATEDIPHEQDDEGSQTPPFVPYCDDIDSRLPADSFLEAVIYSEPVAMEELLTSSIVIETKKEDSKMQSTVREVCGSDEAETQSAGTVEDIANMPATPDIAAEEEHEGCSTPSIVSSDDVVIPVDKSPVTLQSTVAAVAVSAEPKMQSAGTVEDIVNMPATPDIAAEEEDEGCSTPPIVSSDNVVIPVEQLPVTLQSTVAAVAVSAEPEMQAAGTSADNAADKALESFDFKNTAFAQKKHRTLPLIKHLAVEGVNNEIYVLLDKIRGEFLISYCSTCFVYHFVLLFQKFTKTPSLVDQ
jgi:hypothetical protein